MFRSQMGTTKVTFLKNGDIDQVEFKTFTSICFEIHRHNLNLREIIDKIIKLNKK